MLNGRYRWHDVDPAPAQKKQSRTNGGMYVTFSSQGHRHEAFVILFRDVEVAKSRLYIYNVVSRGEKLVDVGCVVFIVRVRRPKAV